MTAWTPKKWKTYCDFIPILRFHLSCLTANWSNVQSQVPKKRTQNNKISNPLKKMLFFVDKIWDASWQDHICWKISAINSRRQASTDYRPEPAARLAGCQGGPPAASRLGTPGTSRQRCPASAKEGWKTQTTTMLKNRVTCRTQSNGDFWTFNMLESSSS